MKNTILSFALFSIFFASCTKAIDVKKIVGKEVTQEKTFTKFTIRQGHQTANINYLTKIECEELKFRVKFDSSAIYKTISPENQGDINKLYGFSDNNGHHQNFSARFGWSWTEVGLSLYAYNYNNAKRDNKFLGIVKIGEEINCSIKVAGDKYIFTHNGKTDTMYRASTTPKAIGYKLFPYFGGDEMAPHDIHIWITE